MTQGRKVKLVLTDGTVLRGTIDEVEDTLTIITETKLRLCIDNNEVERITLFRRD